VRSEYSFLAFLAAIFIYRGLLPAWRSLNTDFRNYYLAARLYRERSSHLCVVDLKSRVTRGLVDGDCNSISPAWEADSRRLIYATDCGRGVEMTTLARVEVPG
jgi:hypothetical protein